MLTHYMINDEESRVIRQYFAQFNSHEDIIKDLNNRLKHVYKKMYDFICDRLPEEEQYGMFFVKILCSSCITNFFYDLDCLQYNLDILVKSPVHSLDHVKNILITEDTLCKLCEDLVLDYASIKGDLLYKKLGQPIRSANRNSGTTSTTSNVGAIQKDISLNLSDVSSAKNQLQAVVYVMMQAQCFVLKLQQEHYFAFKQFVGDHVDSTILYMQFNIVEKKIKNLLILMGDTFVILRQLKSVLNVILLENEKKISGLLSEETSIYFSDSDNQLIRVLTLNRVLSKQKKFQLSNTRANLSVEDSTLHGASCSREYAEQCVVSVPSTFCKNFFYDISSEFQEANQVLDVNTRLPFADLVHKINECFIKDCMTSNSGRIQLMRTLILEAGNIKKLIYMLCLEIDISQLVKIFPNLLTSEFIDHINSGNLVIDMMEDGELLGYDSQSSSGMSTFCAFVSYVRNINCSLVRVISGVTEERRLDTESIPSTSKKSSVDNCRTYDVILHKPIPISTSHPSTSKENDVSFLLDIEDHKVEEPLYCEMNFNQNYAYPLKVSDSEDSFVSHELRFKNEKAIYYKISDQNVTDRDRQSESDQLSRLESMPSTSIVTHEEEHDSIAYEQGGAACAQDSFGEDLIIFPQRVSMSVNSNLVFQYMENDRAKIDLLGMLIIDAGDINQLIRILILEIGQDALLSIFPSISLSDVDRSLLDDSVNTILKSRNGIFLKYCEDGSFVTAHLLQEFVSYVNIQSGKKVRERSIEQCQEEAIVGYSTLEQYAKERVVKDNPALISQEQVHKTQFCKKKLRSDARASLERRSTLLARSKSDISRISRHKQKVDMDDKSGPSALCSNAMESKLGLKKSVSFGVVNYAGASGLSSGVQHLTVDSRRLCNSQQQDISNKKYCTLLRSAMFKMSSNSFFRHKICDSRMLEYFVRTLFDDLYKSVVKFLKFTDILYAQPDYVLLHWILSCIVDNPDYDKCESVIVKDLKPCCTYYKIVTSVAHDLSLALHAANPQDISSITSHAKTMHSLLHKGKAEGVRFYLDKDIIKHEAQKYMLNIGMENADKLRNLIKIFDSKHIMQENLGSFVIKNNLIIASKSFELVSDNFSLDVSTYYNVIIKGNIPQNLTLHCKSLKIYGDVKGKVLASDFGFVEVKGSINGSLKVSNDAKLNKSWALITGNINRFARVAVRNSMIEVYGDVYGDIDGENGNMILAGNTYKGSCINARLGMYLYISSGVNKGGFWLKEIQHVFIDSAIHTDNLRAYKCGFYVRKNKGFVGLNDVHFDCDVKVLSNKFKIDVCELRKCMHIKALRQINSQHEQNTQANRTETEPLCRVSDTQLANKNPHISSCIQNVKIDSLSDLMAI